MIKNKRIKKFLLIGSTSLLAVGLITTLVACSQRSIEPVTYQLYKTNSSNQIQFVFDTKEKIPEHELMNTSFDFQLKSPELKQRATFKPTKVIFDQENKKILISFDLKQTFEPNQSFLVVPYKYFKSFEFLITQQHINNIKKI